MRWRLLAQLIALFAAVAIAIRLAELWLALAVFLIDAISERPLTAIVSIVALCAAVWLCIRGARSAGPALSFISRALLLLFAAAAAVASAEFILMALITFTIGFQNVTLLDYVWTFCGVVLVALAAAGIRRAFGWTIAYWIVLAGVSIAVIVVIVAIQTGIVFS